jgi:hypothetical protein
MAPIAFGIPVFSSKAVEILAQSSYEAGIFMVSALNSSKTAITLWVARCTAVLDTPKTHPVVDIVPACVRKYSAIAICIRTSANVLDPGKG